MIKFDILGGKRAQFPMGGRGSRIMKSDYVVDMWLEFSGLTIESNECSSSAHG